MSYAYLVQAHAENAAAAQSKKNPRSVFVVKRGGNYEVTKRWPDKQGAALVALFQDGKKVEG